MDYDSLIDAETWAFIRATDASFPPEAASLSVAEQRRLYDEMCRAFFNGYPPGITAEDQPVAGVPCRIYAGGVPRVLYLHGGSRIMGGLDSHDDVCAEIRARTGLTVVAADYRLAPEHDLDAGFDDCRNVAGSLAAQGPLVLVGDSAGASLVASTAHALRREHLPIIGQVLIYPGLGSEIDRGSCLRHADAPLLKIGDVAAYRAIRTRNGAVSLDDPTVFPLNDADFSGLPPTAVFSAECDPLCDDGPAYAAKIRAAGGRAHAVVEPGLVHGYLRARTTVTRAADSFTRICNAISALARGDWPYPLEAS